MAGLVAYESSDEEEELKPQPAPEPLRKTEAITADTSSIPSTSTKDTPKRLQPTAKANEEQKPAVYGPQIGPSSGATSFPPLEEDPSTAEPPPLLLPPLPLPPGSPYTATRALLRDLTLPAVPDMAIPPSPPGSPPPADSSRRFEGFLELKRKGVHFNARLAGSAPMRNPALADKLLAFADLDHRDQYRTALGPDLCPWADPDAYPRHAYREQLRQAQTDAAQARARAAGEPVKFVPPEGAATAAVSVSSAAAAGEDAKTAQAAGTAKRKTRFDT
ncbi:putative hcngp-like protein [Rosellinia necatrix]|uniref:Putative hcngp-like protein n=1 Tax=Rosellinia necatrix TaxID=77044 RepID=A0A1W2TPR7_ROSNE|nr:putative hcngp-like protein [Rosellinia necatrix]